MVTYKQLCDVRGGEEGRERERERQRERGGERLNPARIWTGR